MLLRNVLRWYSYIFETILCAMGLLLSALTWGSSHVEVRVPWLPWSGSSRTAWIAGLAIVGLISVGLAARGVFRSLLFVYSGVIVAILLRGLFLNTQYAFQGKADARNALILVAGAFLAFLGALPMRRGKHSRRR